MPRLSSSDRPKSARRSQKPSTVDYIDIHPITPMGRLIGVVLKLLDVALLAVPTGILGSGLVEEFHSRRQPQTCPHCGQNIHVGS